MAVNTFTLLTLEQHLSEALGDFLEFDSTTNIAASATVISTTLRSYDGGEDDHFNDWWLYLTEGNNAAVLRQVSDYASSTGTLTIRGANLQAETAAVTCRLHRYDRAQLKSALQSSVREVYPALYLPLEDQTLITGNILPNASFQSWASSTSVNACATSNVALVRTATTGLVRNGTYSAKVTASASAGYLYWTSDTHRQLLDLQGNSVSLYAWAYPEVAADASIVIYTINAAGSTQTLTSTTSNPAGAWSLLKLEDKLLNDNLEEIQIRLKIATDTKYVYFDDVLLAGRYIYDYLLPDNFRDGHLSNVFIQTQGDPGSDNVNAAYSHKPFSTMHPGEELKFSIHDDGTDRWLHVDETLSSRWRLRLLGYKPLQAMTADADTVTLDDQRLPLIISKAEMIFYERFMRPVSTDDLGRYNFAYSQARDKFMRAMYQHGQSIPSELK